MSGIVSKNAGRGSGIVGTGAIGADAVDGSNIADDAIDSEHYADGSIDNAHIADDAIDSEHYTDGSIDNAHIADDAIDSEHYADGSIDNAHIADDAIDSEHYAAGSIDTAHIADNQITLAKMAGGTDGQIITYDASGDPVAVGPGSDGQVLTSTGAGSPPAFEAAGGGAWTIIETLTASDAASLTIDGLDFTAYDTYAIILSAFDPATDSVGLDMNIGNSGGIIASGSDYLYHTSQGQSSSSAYSATVNAGTSKWNLLTNIGNATGEGVTATLYLTALPDSRLAITGTATTSSANPRARGGHMIGTYIASITADRVRVMFDSGNITSGRMTVWGISYS